MAADDRTSKRPRPTPFMDQILNQLGGLVLGSVPTMVFFILLVVAYGFLVRRPLDRVLAERRARTTGAVEQARGAIAAAEAETAEYEDKLRKAKAEIFQAREQRLKQWNAERDAGAGAGACSDAGAGSRRRRQEIEQSAADGAAADRRDERGVERADSARRCCRPGSWTGGGAVKMSL